MGAFYQAHKASINIAIFVLAIVANVVIASKWLGGIPFGSKRIDILSTDLTVFTSFGNTDFNALPDIPKSLETTVLQDPSFLTLRSLPAMETIKPKDVLIDDDPLVSFGDVRVTNSGIGNSLIITWKKPPISLSAINIYRSPIFGTPGTLLTTLTPEQRSFKDTNVVTGATYYYALRGVSGEGVEAEQLHQYPGKAIDILAPDSPTSLKLSVQGNAAVQLTWDNPTSDDFEFSRVYRSTLPGQLGKLLADKVEEGTFMDTTIIPGVTYYYTVTAVDTSLNESPRNTSPSLTRQLAEYTGILAKGDILLLITNIRAEGINAGTAIRLSWNNPEDSSLARIRLYRSSTFNDTGALIADLPASEESYVDSSVARETAYFYTLRTVDTEGRESDNMIQYVGVSRDVQGPAVPPNIRVTQTIPSEVRVSWSRPSASDLAFYRIYRSTSKDAYGHLVADVVTTESWIDTDIDDNKVYYYVVTAVDTSGNESSKPIPSGVIGGRIPFLPSNP